MRTGRLWLRPVAYADLPALRALKADPRVYAVMLGGVRNACEVAEELAADIAFWGRYGVGMWSVREADSGRFVGTAGLHLRPDGLGMALRFALLPQAQGRGYAAEAAGAALRFAHERAAIARVVAIARQDNIASRQVLGGIGMRETHRFERAGVPMIAYASLAGS